MPQVRTSVIDHARQSLRNAVAVLGKWLKGPAIPAGARTRMEAWVGWLMASRRRSLPALGVGLALAVGLFTTLLPDDSRTELVAAVREGPFEVEVVESATLQALRSVTYSSSIPGNQAKIVMLAPEGSTVNKGDALVRFDRIPFEDELRQTEARLAQARAELVNAEQELKLLKLRNKEELTEARDKQRLAELELASVVEGKGKLAEAESDTRVAQARRELDKALSNYEDLKPLLEEGFITKLELDRARQAVEKAREDLKLIEVKHRTYMEYTRPAEIESARASVHNRKEAYRQSQQAASYERSQAEATLELARSKVTELEGKLAQDRENLVNSEIRSTVSGMVIYKEVFFGTEKRKVQIGDQVWPNQPLVMVPDLSQMVAETQIRETDIYKVERNQRVVVFIEAYPDLQLAGEVSFIGTLAQEREGGKYFRVAVLIREVDPRLRPGMTARVEVLVDRLENALFVPLETVFEKGGRRYCYVMRGDEVVPAEVLTGPSNENHVVIEAGLEPGQRILLYDPSRRRATPDDEGPSLLEMLGANPVSSN